MPRKLRLILFRESGVGSRESEIKIASLKNSSSLYGRGLYQLEKNVTKKLWGLVYLALLIYRNANILFNLDRFLT